MAAGEDCDSVIETVAFEFSNHLPRKLRQEGQVILCVNDQRLPFPAGKLFEVGHRADGGPQRAESVDVEMRLHALADVAGGLSMPDHVGDVCGSMVECRDLDSRTRFHLLSVFLYPIFISLTEDFEDAVSGVER